MNPAAPLEFYEAEERVVPLLDSDNGVARRWMVKPRHGAGDGHLVILTKTSANAWGVFGKLLCGCGIEGCAHVERVQRELDRSRRIPCSDLPPAA
jgi:hypothetical protein